MQCIDLHAKSPTASGSQRFNPQLHLRQCLAAANLGSPAGTFTYSYASGSASRHPAQIGAAQLGAHRQSLQCLGALDATTLADTGANFGRYACATDAMGLHQHHPRTGPTTKASARPMMPSDS